ncbi:MAG TPA: DNA methyltransferase [Xanthobacteraceae bacterium]|jgi:DNA modification methylase
MTPWPADRVERRPVATLVSYARNARTHAPAQVAEIAGSIREWGWTIPVLVAEDGTIIAGHGRVLAAQQLGLADIPVMVAAGWSEAQRRAYALADNKLALNAGWDMALLRVELADLRNQAIDLATLGFSDAEVAALIGRGGGLTDPDDVPPLPEAPVSRPGDLWLCGSHRLLCGDATNGADVTRLIGDAKPLLMVTDPPYGVEYDPQWRHLAKRATNGRLLSVGAHAVAQPLNDGRIDWRDAWAHFPGDVAYVWHAGRHTSGVQASLEAVNFDIRSQIIWAKNNIVIGRGHYHWQHEPCWYAVRRGKSGHWSGDRMQSTLWQIDKPLRSETGHSTQKPVACMARPITNNSRPGDAVYDPFLGSGTTVIAAEMAGRHCLALEISAAFVDVAVKRWEAFTGQDATLEDGTSYKAVKHARATPEADRAA